MTHAPSSSADWPVSIRRYLTAKLLEKMLAQHDGWQGLVKWMYAGQFRKDERLPYDLTMDFLWKLIEEDAAEWNASRNSHPQGTHT